MIVANGDDGIQVKSLTTGVRITGNRIYANDGLGIDLEGGTEDSAGVTANDSGDPDTGANNLQNFPVLTSANFNVVTGVTTIDVSLSSDASTAFTVELFVVAGADPSGHGEGKRVPGEPKRHHQCQRRQVVHVPRSARFRPGSC